jgi:hypothetical protein
MRIATIYCLIGIAAVIATAQTGGPVACDTSKACFPWNSAGPFCGRGSNINMRFHTQFTAGTNDTAFGAVGSLYNATYAFCPRVDELQAFNITRVGTSSFTFLNGTDADGVPLRTIMPSYPGTRYLSIIGFGDTRNKEYPQDGSEGRVMIADYWSSNLDGTARCAVGTDIAVVPFLVANVSMTKGHFEYFGGHPQPAGVGFQPTCDDTDVCLIDGDMFCIGDRGNRNCATCVNADAARGMTVQVWVSYYGTDASGRQLRSGASNPLNFQKFSGTGVGNAMSRSFKDIKSGNVRDGSDDLEEPR